MLGKSARSLLGLLSDGEWHSGEDLGRELAISRASISKHCKQFRELGLVIDSQVGLGYRLEDPIELLSESGIRAALSPDTSLSLSAFHLFPSLESTNSFLMDRARTNRVHGEVCLAEMQTAGRGRRGRNWVSPFAKNIYLSLGWRFDSGVAAIEGLSLVIGLELCLALEELGFERASLKWPNDVLVGSKKLAGILVELVGDADGEYSVVIGVGINVRSSAEMGKEIDQPWTSLDDCGFSVSREQLLGRFLSRLLRTLPGYPEKTFAEYQNAWMAHDAFAGFSVELKGLSQPVVGLARGVDRRGALVLEVDGEEQAFVGGEVSLRLAQ